MLKTEAQIDIKSNIRIKAIQSFMRYGIKNFTMDDLAREMGMSKKTLYKYYNNKVELLQEALNEYEHTDNDQCVKIYEKSFDPIETMFLLYKQIIQSLESVNPAVIFELKKYYPEMWQKFNAAKSNMVLEKVKNNLEQGIQLGIYRSDLDVDIIPLFYYATVMALSTDEEFYNEKLNKLPLLREFLIYHLNGIASKNGKKLIEKYTNKYFKQ